VNLYDECTYCGGLGQFKAGNTRCECPDCYGRGQKLSKEGAELLTFVTGNTEVIDGSNEHEVRSKTLPPISKKAMDHRRETR
jgi:hypothetical protein